MTPLRFQVNETELSWDDGSKTATVDVRTCDQCGIKMPKGVARRPRDGKQLCEGCANGREGRPLTGSKNDWHEWTSCEFYGHKETPDAAAEGRHVCSDCGEKLDTDDDPTVKQGFIMATAPRMRGPQGRIFRVAHMGNDETVIYHCFRGDTRYWTYDGLKTLADTVGTVQRVLTFGPGGTVWREAIIHSFGEQPLMKVTLQRNKLKKELFATPEHRWIIRTKSDNYHRDIRTTADLQSGDRLAYALPKSAVGRSTPSTFGIAHGIVFGDGTLTTDGAVVRLWGDKDAQLIRYFNESKMYPEKTPNGVLGQRIVGLPNYMKAAPDLNESTAYLYGFLAGWFAADGSVNKQGQAILYSANRSHLELAQLIATRLGIATYGISSKTRQGYGDDPSEMHQMQFIGSTLRPDFFLIAEHRTRYEDCSDRGNPERIGWTVVSVEATDLVEEVYCPRVPETENFVLEDFINTANCPFCGSGQVLARSDGTTECDFCDQVFIVQIQPQHPEMPQTVNGMPYQIPGMPTPSEGSNLPPGATPNAPQTAGTDHASFGGDNLATKAPAAGTDGGTLPPPGKTSALITEDGVALDEDSYLAHLALKHTSDRDATISEVRALRGVQLSD
jgi:LAGLIDADG-like domain